MPSRVKGTKDHGISTSNLKARVTRMQNKLAESFNDLFGFWMVYIFLIFVFTNSFFLEHARPLSFQGIASRSTVGLVFCCGHHCGHQTRYDGRDATNGDDDFKELGYLEKMETETLKRTTRLVETILGVRIRQGRKTQLWSTSVIVE